MKKAKEIQTIYDWAVNYLNGNNSVSAYEIIHKCADVIKNIPEFDDLWARLSAHINLWTADSLGEICEEAEQLIEEITGYLGEWLSEN